MEIIYLATFQDKGNIRLIGGLAIKDRNIDKKIDENLYIELTKEVYDYLRENIYLVYSAMFRVDKTIKKIESIDQIERGSSDQLSDGDKLEIKKMAVIQRVYNRFFQRLDMKTLYDFFNFTIQNNKLMSNGIFITDENRDEEYLKILSSVNSEDLNVKENAEKNLCILSDYLESIDSLSDHFNNFKIFNEFKNKIFDSENDDEVEDVITEYEKKFF